MSTETQTKSLGLLFFSGPYQSQACESVYHIATAALNKGYKVQVFCYMDAANAVLKDQKKIQGMRNIEESFSELVDRGVVFRICNLCLQVRGTSKSMLKKKSETGGKIKRAGTPDLAKIVDETDKFLVIR